MVSGLTDSEKVEECFWMVNVLWIFYWDVFGMFSEKRRRGERRERNGRKREGKKGESLFFFCGWNIFWRGSDKINIVFEVKKRKKQKQKTKQKSKRNIKDRRKNKTKNRCFKRQALEIQRRNNRTKTEQKKHNKEGKQTKYYMKKQLIKETNIYTHTHTNKTLRNKIPKAKGGGKKKRKVWRWEGFEPLIKTNYYYIKL